MLRRTTLSSALLIGLLAGCGGDGGPRDPDLDSGTDSGTDSGIDSGTDAGVDSGPGDSGTDTGPDCIDGDGDGYGEGCGLGTDCNDEDAAINPGAAEACNGVDDDCDDEIDEELTAPSCAMADGVCAGAVKTCGGTDGWLDCTADDYGADYVEDEDGAADGSVCDGMDNDCDGTTDEDCPCAEGETQECGTDVGECSTGTQTCTAELTWGPCEEDVGPMGETCDGLDNDCDGMTDEPGDLTAPECPLQDGVCAGALRECLGSDGWGACAGTDSYGGDYEESETTCEGLDNDCDGVVDDGCTCVDGDTQPCGSDVGACTGGTQTCSSGAWGACVGATEPVDETCNGVDDDCDGSIDNGLTAPACALQDGVCSGSSQSCGGEAGFEACTADEYGPSYEADETSCDGLDNDCDGTIDEGCECVVDETQECGSSTGACERGTQTCTAEGWGSCEGGVAPAEETCNGLDDDCNGMTDDNLTAPACALQEGVCADTTKECAGTGGWLDCDAATYGTDYLADEDGSADEAHCDGLDNDCDGETDENCTSGPIVSVEEDAIAPTFYDMHMAFLGNVDGNWDVFFYDFRTDTVSRVTTTPEDESAVHAYGNYLTYVRGADADARVYAFDLETATETQIATTESGHPRIWRSVLVYERYNGSDWDVHAYNLADDTDSPIVDTSANEFGPDMRNGRISYITDTTGMAVTHILDIGESTDTAQTASPAGQHAVAILDHATIGWTDSRNVSDVTDLYDDWDVYGAEIADFTTEQAVVTATGAQHLGQVDGTIFAWSDHRNGNWDVAISALGGSELLITSSDAAQAAPYIHGSIVAWQDNRLGSFDIYASSIGGTAPGAGHVTINEVLADPPPDTDVNGDGTADTSQDEFVELTNATVVAMDVSACTLSDAVSVRHTFPAGSVIPATTSLVVFGGGSGLSGRFGGAKIQTASSGMLGINNGGDTLTLECDGTTIDTVTFGSEAGNDEALVRVPEYGGDLTRASMDPDAVGPYSPGTLRTGFGF